MSFEFQGKTCSRSRGYMNEEAADVMVCELLIQWGRMILAGNRHEDGTGSCVSVERMETQR